MEPHRVSRSEVRDDGGEWHRESVGVGGRVLHARAIQEARGDVLRWGVGRGQKWAKVGESEKWGER